MHTQCVKMNGAGTRRELTAENVGMSALYLLSPMSDAVTGICHYVDNGQHPVGMHRVGSIDIYKDDYVFDEGGIAPLGEAPSAKF